MARRHLLWPLRLIVTLLIVAGIVAIWQEMRQMRETQERMRFNQELLCLALAYHRFAEDEGVSPHELAEIEADRDTFPQVNVVNVGQAPANPFIHVRW